MKSLSEEGRKKFIRLQEGYRKRLPERYNLMHREWQELRRTPLRSARRLSELRSELHNLAGSAGGYGFAPISRLAREILQQLPETPDTLPSMPLKRLDALFLDLRQQMTTPRL